MSAALRVALIGAGASGLYAARRLACGGAAVTVFEAQALSGKKLCVCGGGAGNISNVSIEPLRDYVSENPRFVFSTLRAFEPKTMLRYVEARGIGSVLRENGCYFCAGRAADLRDALFSDAQRAGARFFFDTKIIDIAVQENQFELTDQLQRHYTFDRVVLCCGGRSYAQISGSSSGYVLAQKLGIGLVEPRPALCPILFPPALLAQMGDLSGIALPSICIACGKHAFEGSLVFRPDGLGGIAVFKCSLFLAREGGAVTVNFLPNVAIPAFLTAERQRLGTRSVKALFAPLLPKRLLAALLGDDALLNVSLAQLTKAHMQLIAEKINHFTFTPPRLGAWDEAEVTLGGLSTADFSSSTLESRAHPNLYAAGEVLDVTGELGGYNLHWAFASAETVCRAILGERRVK